jgi:hypothetical protein
MRKSSTGKMRGVCGVVLCLLAGTQALAAGAGEVTITNRVGGWEAGEKLAGPRSPVRGGALSLPAGFDAGASVQGIYKRFIEAAKASGEEIDLAIANVTTHYPNQFADLSWLSLFTLPGDLVIDTVPYQRAGKLPSKTVVSFHSAWREAKSNFEAGEDLLRASPSLSAASALERLAAWDPVRLEGVAALSSFDVEVSFQGKSRGYRAMILWKPLSADTLLFTLVDHVVPGVDLAFSEERSIVRFEEIGARISGGDPQSKILGGCYSTHFDLFNPQLTLARFEGHSTGDHRGELRLGRVCDTTSICESFCTPYAAWSNCAEWGSLSNILVTHRMYANAAISSISGFGAGVSSNCGYALGCAVKQCPLGVCSGGVSFSLSGSGATISMIALSSVLSDLSVSSGGVCPGAQEKEPICKCCESASAVTVVGVSSGGDQQELPNAGVPLRRLEESSVKHHGQNVRYLMAEWALVSYSPVSGQSGRKARVLGASSDAFSQDQVEGLVDALAADPRTKRRAGGEQVALLVATPSHEANSRSIPMPDFEVAASRPPAGSGRGTVLVMADFDEDHQLQEFRILHETVGGVSQELATHLERSVSLRPFSSQKHRVVVFALLSVGTTTAAKSTYSYLPKCCCGGEFCI